MALLKGFYWTSKQAAAPYTDEMTSSMISGLHIKYYAHLKNNYCKGPEESEYMRKNAKQVGPEGNLFKIHEICKPSSKRKKQA